jgi:GT2 family glycosyltransferase
MLRQAVLSLQQGIVPPTRIIIVDNSPVRLPPDIFSTITPTVEYIWAGTNAGYGRGHNIALDQLASDETAPFHLIMNPDVTVRPETLQRLLAALAQDTKIGMALPRVLNEDGTLQPHNKREPCVLDLALRFAAPRWLRMIFQKRMDHYEMRDTGYDDPCEVESASGAFMLCRMATLRAVGGFDPRYFMYLEDFDLSRTLRKNGFRLMYFPDAAITHLWERASHKHPRMALAHSVSVFRYFSKWGWKLL